MGPDVLRVPGSHPEGLGHELLAVEVSHAPLLLEALGFARDDEAWVARGEQRHAVLTYDRPPTQRGNPSAGIVHHVAWSAADDREG